MRLAAICLLLAACDDDPPRPCQSTKLDRECYQRRFDRCLELLPRGPERIDNSNDWAEVVEECVDAAEKGCWEPFKGVNHRDGHGCAEVLP